ncbi:MAG: DUF1963 domain-containing protein [Armatimonadetes bacterium]|nr:DUF1963 domain-containing protein [Armatimonadota bacterium]
MKTRAEIHEAIVAAGMETLLAELDTVIVPAIDLLDYGLRGDAIPTGGSKRYGKPDLPPEFSWPCDQSDQPWGFVAQFNLEEAARFDVEKQLPASGLISFFLSLYGEGRNQIGACGVFYFPELASLKRREFPEGHFTGHSETSVQYWPCWSAPCGGDYPGAKLEFNIIEDMRNGDTQLLGHPDDYQGELEPLCEEIYTGRPMRELSTEGRRQTYRDWVCLFKESEFSGGVFTHNWLIRREHLAVADFSKVIRIDVN